MHKDFQDGGKAQGALTYQLKVMHSHSRYTNAVLNVCVSYLNLVVYSALLVLEQCIECHPLHEHTDKLQSDKDLKEGTKAVIAQRFEQRTKAFTYQLKVVHSRSTIYECSFF